MLGKSDAVESWLTAGLITGVVGLFLILGYFAGYNHDEIEHMHVAFLMTQGLLPYQDFPQNHLPTVWFFLIPFVKSFPHSLNAFLVVRLIQVCCLVPICLIARSFLSRVEGVSRFMSLTVLFLMLAMHLSYSQWILIRPDVPMTVFTTLGLALVAAKRLSYKKLVLAGLLLGVATCFSIKSWHAYLVIFAVLTLRYPSVGVRRIMCEVLSICIGSAIALTPMVLWLWENGLVEQFVSNVVLLNGSVALRLSDRVRLFQSPVTLASLAGALVMLMKVGRDEHQRRKMLLMAGLVLVYPFVFQLHNHGTSYHSLIIAMPAAVVITYLFQEMYSRLGIMSLRMALMLILPVGLACTEAAESALQGVRDTHLRKRNLKRFIKLTKGSSSTCTAFSQYHPVFCRDVSGAMLSWDLIFYQKFKSETFKSKYRILLYSAYEESLRQEPDIIVERGHFDIWRRLHLMDIISDEELSTFRKMTTEKYFQIHIENATVLLKKATYGEKFE